VLKFKSLVTTEDGRLTVGTVYVGNLVGKAYGLRIAVYDNLNQWMTFDPKVFVPHIEGKNEQLYDALSNARIELIAMYDELDVEEEEREPLHVIEDILNKK